MHLACPYVLAAVIVVIIASVIVKDDEHLDDGGSVPHATSATSLIDNKLFWLIRGDLICRQSADSSNIGIGIVLKIGAGKQG